MDGWIGRLVVCQIVILLDGVVWFIDQKMVLQSRFLFKIFAKSHLTAADPTTLSPLPETLIREGNESR